MLGVIDDCAVNTALYRVLEMTLGVAEVSPANVALYRTLVEMLGVVPICITKSRRECVMYMVVPHSTVATALYLTFATMLGVVPDEAEKRASDETMPCDSPLMGKEPMAEVPMAMV